MLETIVSALGINSTLFVQLGIYLFAYVLLYYIAFKPYFLASEERKKMTSGSSDIMKRSHELIQQSEEKFQKRARQINEEVSFMFNEQRSMASKEVEKIQKDALEKAKDISAQTQQQISLQLEQAAGVLNQTSSEVSQVIVKQILNSRGGAQ
ncbi:MAG: ATP synthase F0 subunit B [Bdellovibrionaceae bacterium]|nr:ATP synthase F0 subunit B [Pseudobdellovibrionaceae bacterium]